MGEKRCYQLADCIKSSAVTIVTVLEKNILEDSSHGGYTSHLLVKLNEELLHHYKN